MADKEVAGLTRAAADDVNAERLSRGAAGDEVSTIMSSNSERSASASMMRIRVGVVSPRARAQRFEVTEADLNMYAVITGRSPTDEERLNALHPEAAEPAAADADTDVAVADQPGARRRGWSPGLLGAHLRGACPAGTVVQARRAPVPVGTWVRRLSGEARSLMQEARARLGAMRRAG